MVNLTNKIRQHFHLHTPLDNFEDYCNTIESQFESKLKIFKEAEASISDEEIDDYFDFYIDDYTNFSDTFPDIHRKSLFITLYSYFENQLISICNEQQEIKNSSISISDLRGNGIEKAQKYFKKVLSIEFPDSTKEWVLLKKYNSIRNCIVHNQGDVNVYNDTKTLNNIITDFSYISTNRDDIILLQKEFCYEFLQLVRTFLSKLYDIVYA
jgi:hypothetical protein